MRMKHILFVCTGNSCRSVMAQGLLQHFLARVGIGGIAVESAGVFAVDGMAATRETQSVLREIGVDCSGHRSRPLTAELAEGADLIFVMEPFQAEEIARRFPEAKTKAHLLKPYGLPPGQLMGSPAIPDPIGKPLEVYEVCFAEIREAVERIVKSLKVASG